MSIFSSDDARCVLFTIYSNESPLACFISSNKPALLPTILFVNRVLLLKRKITIGMYYGAKKKLSKLPDIKLPQTVF